MGNFTIERLYYGLVFESLSNADVVHGDEIDFNNSIRLLTAPKHFIFF